MAWADVAARLSFTGFDAAEETTIKNALEGAYNGSAKTKAMLDKVVSQNRTLEIEELAGAFEAFAGNFKIRIDLAELSNALYIDKNGKAVEDTATTAILHELVHAIEGLRDEPRDTNTNSEGPTVSFVNEQYVELGSPEQASYEGYDTTGTLVKDKEYTGGEAIENALMSNARRDTTANSPATKDLMVGLGNTNNQFLSGGGRDFLWGMGGNDTLTGGAGNDVIEGGAGVDVASYSGTCTDYTITEGVGGIWTINDNRAGSPDGTDTIREVEKLEFSDGISDVIPGEKVACPGQNLVLLVDTSGSMGDDIAQVKTAASQIVESLFGTTEKPLNSRFAIVDFNDTRSINTVLFFTDQAKIADRKTAALNGINSLFIRGGGAEPMYGAMLSALTGGAGVWEAGATSNRLVIFSDEPPADPLLSGAAFAAAAALNTQVTQPLSPRFDYATDLALLPVDNTVNVVALPVVIGNNQRAKDAAEEIAKATGGKVFTAQNAAEAAQAVIEAVNTGPVISSPEPIIEPAPNLGTLASSKSSNLRAGIEAIQSSAKNVVVGDSSSNSLLGTPQSDFIRALDGLDSITGLDGNDYINGNSGNDSINGGGGTDVARGGGGNDFVNGNAGNDFVFGDSGDDIVRGGKGDDIINGNSGNDRMFGDLGADCFILSKGNDVIEDFSFSEGDVIAILQGQAFSLSESSEGLIVSRGSSTTTLLGVDINQFTSFNPIQLI